MAGKTLVMIGVGLLVASGASAAMLEDFESGNSFAGDGIVVADPEDAGNNVLFIDRDELATLALAAPLAAGEAISMRVYDQGLSAMDDPDNPGQPAADSRPVGTNYGWNVGVSGDYNWGVALVNKSFLSANAMYSWTDQYYDIWPQAGSIFSLYFVDGPRQVDALSVIGTGTVDDPEIPGDGAWSTWTFTFNADGSIALTNDGMANVSVSPTEVETGIDEIYLYGGRDSDLYGTLGRVWIDDVQIVPEPATMSLLTLGAAALIRRKR